MASGARNALTTVNCLSSEYTIVCSTIRVQLGASTACEKLDELGRKPNLTTPPRKLAIKQQGAGLNSEEESNTRNM